MLPLVAFNIEYRLQFLPARAEHVAVVDRDLCEGCGLCAECRQFHAIDCIQEDGKTISLG